MIDRDHALALATQARLLGMARSMLYREPQPVSATDLAAMRRIDELHLNHPFAGSRMLRAMLVNEGIAIGRSHVRTLMRRMGIEALYRRPRTSAPAPGHNDLSVPAARCGCHPAQPSVGSGHHLHPDGQGLRLPRCGAGLVQSACAVVACFDHVGSRFLC
jgi:hypothetical protein